MTVAAFFDEYKLALSNLNVVPVSESGNERRLVCPQLRRKLLHMSTGSGKADLLCSGELSHIRAMVDAFGTLNRGAASANAENDIAATTTLASEYARSTGFGEFELLGLCDRQPFFNSSTNQRITAEYPYFGSVTIAGQDARRFSELLMFTGMELVGAGRTETVERKRERIAVWLPFMLMEHDRRLETSSRSIEGGRYYEVFDYRGGTLQPLGSTLTTSITLSGLKGRSGATISCLHFHVYLGERLSVLVLKKPTWISGVDGVELPYEAFSVYDVGELLDAEPPRPTSCELMVRLLMSPDLSRFRLSGSRGAGSNRGVFYSSPRRIFKVTPGEDSLVLELEQETFNLNADRLALNIAPRSNWGGRSQGSATPIDHS